MSEQYLMANGLRLCYEEFGAPSDPAMVLIMGLGTQMISWPDAFCQGLASRGFRVIRFDNRDIGLSQKIETQGKTNLFKAFIQSRLGWKVDAPYTLRDMAKDTVGVIDFLGIDKAHWVGASMGGMIAQLVAAEFPNRTLSLTSMMSTTGRKNLPQTSLKALRQMMTRPPVNNEQAYLEHALKTWAIIGSPDYPPTKEELTNKIMRSARRSSYPAGYRNQVAAIAASGDRRGVLHRVTCPTLVIHGKEDILVPVEGGIDTAKNIRGSRLELIAGMGHDLPRQLHGRFCDLIVEITQQAQPTST